MEQRINLVEILKNCPRGMELDCSLHTRPVILNCVKIENNYPIRISSKEGYSHSLTYWGSLYNCEDAKCVIFPKGKTTWDGFVPPCNFKNGDVISNGLYIAIFYKTDKPENCVSSNVVYYNCFLNSKYGEFKAKIDYGIGVIGEYKYATEEEKETLFDVIKANGLRWNDETKTLE